MAADSTTPDFDTASTFEVAVTASCSDCSNTMNEFCVSTSCEQGRRAYQEDTFFVGENVVGIFDGHGGSRVSKLAQTVFAEEQPNTEDEIRNVFNRVADLTSDDVTGSTAIVVGIDRDAGVASVGNLGDSPCLVIYKNGTIERLSIDHTPDNERQRIRAAGQRVIRNRIIGGCGSIAVSRAFGDAVFPAVISEGSFRTESLDNVVCIIICSDGVTDGLKDDEIRDVVLGAPNDTAANSLTKAAMRSRGWKGDNTTVVVVWIDQSETVGPVTVVNEEGDIVPIEAWPAMAHILRDDSDRHAIEWNLVIDSTGVIIDCKSGLYFRKSEFYFDILIRLLPTQHHCVSTISRTLGRILDESLTEADDYIGPDLDVCLGQAVSAGVISIPMAQQIQIWWSDGSTPGATADGETVP
jgi:serine/threonine protein phosphatase PrpC